MADQLKQIKEFPQKPDFGDDDLLLIQGNGTTYNVSGRAVKRYAENAAAPQVELARKEAQAAAAAAVRAEDAIQHPAIPDSNTGNWLVWDQVSESYQQTEPPVRAEGQDFEIRGYYPTLEALEAAVPEPDVGAAYGVGLEIPYDIYVWDAVNRVWVNNGALQGPRGEQGPEGPQGPPGAPGPSGADGAGIPEGGTIGQILTKASSINQDVEWKDPPATGVKSFKGRTGAVVPNSGDYSVSQVTGAAPTSTPVFSGNISLSRKAGTTAGSNSIAVGYQCEASGFCSQSFGYQTKATSHESSAEGSQTISANIYCHAEGYQTTASGEAAHAEGYQTDATMKASHAGGIGTIAYDSGQTAIGTYNVDRTYLGDKFIVGKGDSESKRANAFRVSNAGVYGTGAFNSSGADYAELFEWADGNPLREDRAGRFVTLEGERIRLAGPGDGYILGIVSGAPSVVGDVYDDQWQGMYLTDVFGRPIFEDVEVPAETEEVEFPVEVPGDGEEAPQVETRREVRVAVPAHTDRRQKLNPDYDPAQTYVPRSERPEWDAVGLLGKLVAVDDGTCVPNGWATVGEGGAATNSEERTRYRVMARLDERHVRILIL